MPLKNILNHVGWFLILICLRFYPGYPIYQFMLSEQMPKYTPKTIEELPEILPILQAARLLGVHPNTLRNWEKSGKITPMRIGERKDRRYKKSEILAMTE
jgi:hypothetical protein